MHIRLISMCTRKFECHMQIFLMIDTLPYYGCTEKKWRECVFKTQHMPSFYTIGIRNIPNQNHTPHKPQLLFPIKVVKKAPKKLLIRE